jgi:cardiolipin synthase
VRGLHHLPNVISTLRLILVAPIGWCLWHLQLRPAMLLVALAGASDLLDGFLAKRFGWRSRLGALLDPAADKLLLVTLFAILAMLQRVPVWLALAVLGREVVLVSGALAYRLLYGPVAIRPSRVSKLNTAVEVLYILLVIAHAALAEPSAGVLTAVGAVTFGTIVVSGLDYVLRYGRQAVGSARAGAPGASPSSHP